MTRNNSERCLEFARHDKKGLIVGRSCETPFECCGVWHPQCDQGTAVGELTIWCCRGNTKLLARDLCQRATVARRSLGLGSQRRSLMIHIFVIPSAVEESLTFSQGDNSYRSFDFAQDDK